jgi:hypothetical protein
LFILLKTYSQGLAMPSQLQQLGEFAVQDCLPPLLLSQSLTQYAVRNWLTVVLSKPIFCFLFILLTGAKEPPPLHQSSSKTKKKKVRFVFLGTQLVLQSRVPRPKKNDMIEYLTWQPYRPAQVQEEPEGVSTR